MRPCVGTACYAYESTHNGAISLTGKLILAGFLWLCMGGCPFTMGLAHFSRNAMLHTWPRMSQDVQSDSDCLTWVRACRQKARAMCGEPGFAAILDDARVEAVVLVLPPSVALEVCCASTACSIFEWMRCILAHAKFRNAAPAEHTMPQALLATSVPFLISEQHLNRCCDIGAADLSFFMQPLPSRKQGCWCSM